MNEANTTDSHLEELDLIAESECCGNGCANCVLNIGFRKSMETRMLGRKNVMCTYRNFRLLNRRAHNPKCNHDTNGHDTDLAQVLELQFGIDDTLSNAADYFLDIPVGCHIMMRIKLAASDYCLRPYSPYWVDALAMEFKILVNLEPNGHMSHYINNLQVGETAEFRGPIGAYELSENCDKERYIFLITQGVAIAPTIRIVQQILENDEDISRVFQLACYKDMDHAYFRKKLRELNKYWNYKSRIYLAHQHCPSKMCKDGECTGICTWFQDKLWYKEVASTQRLDKFELLDLCTSFKEGSDLIFIIAGSKLFQETLTATINKSGINVLEENIFLL